MQKYEDLLTSLSSWAILDYKLGAEDPYTCRQ